MDHLPARNGHAHGRHNGLRGRTASGSPPGKSSTIAPPTSTSTPYTTTSQPQPPTSKTTTSSSNTPGTTTHPSSTSSSYSSSSSSTTSSSSSSSISTNIIPTTMTNTQTTSTFFDTLSGSPTLTDSTTSLALPSNGTDTTPSASSSHLGTGLIVAIAAGALAGIAALFIIVGFIRRRMRNKDDDYHDRFNRDSFIRASMVLPDDHSPDVIMGSRNALALAKQNMGSYETDVKPDPGWAGAGAGAGYYGDHWNQPQDTYPPYNGQYGGYPAPDPHQQYDQYGRYHDHQLQQGGNGTNPADKYAEVARALEIPAVSVAAPPPDNEYGRGGGYGRSSPPGGRPLTVKNNAYDEQGRSGTPLEPNPQQTYHPAPRSGFGQGYEDDAYGGM